MADINDIDQFIGRYVSLTDPDGESAAGFLIQVDDEVDYVPYPVRNVVLDWGQGWSVGQGTELDVYPAAPDGQESPKVSSGIDVLHEAAHSGSCPDGNCRVRARIQLRALREWRMRQEDAYWKHRYRQARENWGAPEAIAYIMRKAAEEKAPERILAHLALVAEGVARAVGDDS